LTALETDLCKVGSSDPSFVSTILDAYTQHPHLKQKSAYHRQVHMILPNIFCHANIASFLGIMCKKTFYSVIGHDQYVACFININLVLVSAFNRSLQNPCITRSIMQNLFTLLRLDVIDRCFSKRTMEEIISALVSFSLIYRICRLPFLSWLSLPLTLHSVLVRRERPLKN